MAAELGTTSDIYPIPQRILIPIQFYLKFGHVPLPVLPNQWIRNRIWFIGTEHVLVPASICPSYDSNKMGRPCIGLEWHES